MQSEIPDAFAAGLFLPARQAIPFDEVLVEYANSESLQPYLAPSTDDGDVHVHVDEDRHLDRKSVV